MPNLGRNIENCLTDRLSHRDGRFLNKRTLSKNKSSSDKVWEHGGALVGDGGDVAVGVRGVGDVLDPTIGQGH